MYDITYRESLNKLNSVLKNIHEKANKNISIILIGNMCDLEYRREVSLEEGKEFAEKNNLKFIEISCKENINVEKAFNILIEEMIQKANQDDNNKNTKLKNIIPNDKNVDKIKKLENLNNKIKEELNEEKSNNKNLKKSIEELKKIIKEKDKIINNEKKNYQKLHKKLEELKLICNKDKNLNKVMGLIDELKEKEKEINELKNILPFNLSKEEKILTVNFISDREDIICSIISKNTYTFNDLENSFYKKNPEYQDMKQNFF